MNIKSVKFLTGAGIAVAVILIFHILFLTVQSSFFPMETLFLYLRSTNYTEDLPRYYYDIQATDEDLYFDFHLPDENNAFMFKSVIEKDFSISSLSESQENFSILTENGWRLFDLREMKKPLKIRLELKKGGRLILLSTPLTGQIGYLRFFSQFNNLISNQFVMIISGMSFLLAFIMFSIGMVNKTLSKSYFALAVSLSYYGILFFLSGTALNDAGTVYSMVQNVHGELFVLHDVFNILSLCFTVLLFFGIEYFILKDWKYTKTLILLNLIGFILSLFGVPYMITVISFINFIFFAIVSYHSNIMLFTFLAFVRPLGEIVNTISSRLYSLYPFSLNEITFFIVFIGFGAFFIMDYNRKQREIKAKNEELSASNEEIMAMNQELESSYLEIEKLNNDLEDTVLRRTQQLRKSMHSIQTLLNNTDEGFLKFDASLIVEPDYSRECLSIFNASIDYHFFPALIFSDTPEEIPFITETLRAVIKEASDDKREILISLLPETVHHRSKILSVKYRFILEKMISEQAAAEISSHDLDERPKMMVMIRDITEKIVLKDKYEKEKELFEQIVKIMANSENFVELQNDYYQFWHNLSESLQAIDNEGKSGKEQSIDDLFRNIHTFKGNFASFGFHYLVEKLHHLESQLKESKDHTTEILLSILENGDYEKWLAKDMQNVYDYISPQILERQIDLNKKRQSLLKIRSLLNGTPTENDLKVARLLLDEIDKTSFEDIFDPTRNLVLSTAKRLDVNLKNIQVTGSNVFVDKYKLKPLLKTWIHLFRNILDHAIEDPETRVEKGKEPGATISVEAQKTSENLIIKIIDDGRGIDRELVVKKAYEKGILTEQNLDLLSFNLEDILFREGFTTKDIPTDISGRGVGLNAVKSAVDSLSGRIEIKTQKGRGTTFSIIIPLETL